MVVDFSFNPQKFLPCSILFAVSMEVNRFVIIFVLTFQKVSSNAIGRVFAMLKVNLLGFGIGIIVDCFHAVGLLLREKQKLKNFNKIRLKDAGSFLIML